MEGPRSVWDQGRCGGEEKMTNGWAEFLPSDFEFGCGCGQLGCPVFLDEFGKVLLLGENLLGGRPYIVPWSLLRGRQADVVEGRLARFSEDGFAFVGEEVRSGDDVLG